MQKIAVVPAYEPDEKMFALLCELKENAYLILVVDDGSGPTFAPVFEKAMEYAQVLTHSVNRGKGAALKTAFSYIQKNYQDYIIVTLDCDGQHTVADANKLCEYLTKNPDHLVIGKRLRSKKTPLRSRIGNSITRLVYHLATKVSIYDTQTGLRAFTHLLMNFMLNIPGDRYEYEMNMLLECSKQHIQIKEIEITTIYFDNNANSHFNTLKDSYKVYWQILKFSCVSLSSFLIDYLLYIFFNLFLKNILVVNILSRLISSFWNYTLNKKIVFKEKNKSSLLRYYLLVIVILLLNTAMLGILVNYLAMNKYLAKILVEFILFILSFFIQKIFVFKAKTSDNNM